MGYKTFFCLIPWEYLADLHSASANGGNSSDCPSMMSPVITEKNNLRNFTI